MTKFVRITLSFALLYSVFAFTQDEDKPQPTHVTVHARDYCDPATFAAIGCHRDPATGLITLAGFGAELAAEKSVGAWRFITSPTSADQGANITVTNLGGEVHTFTRVKEFGGGFVAPLNAGSGNNVPAPECAKIVNGSLVPQPPSDNNIFLPAGASATAQVQQGELAHFQCCIHPWMRTTIDARGESDQQTDKDDNQ